MQLIDTLTLPTAQFASLSILLQLHHEDFSSPAHRLQDRHPVDQDPLQERRREEDQPTLHQCHSSISDKPKFVPVYPEHSRVYYTAPSSNDDDAKAKQEATVSKVHYDDSLVPYYTITVDGMETRADYSQLSPISTSGNNDVDDVGGDDGVGDDVRQAEEADKSAGSTKRRRRRTLSHSVLRHELTTLSPFCLISQDTMQMSLECLHGRIMAENGMRDDFCDIGTENANADMQSTISKENDQSTKDVETTEEEPRVGSGTAKQRKGVSFRRDTKAGTSETAPTTPGSEGRQTNNTALNGVLPVKVYKPPSRCVRCPFGLNLYYVQIDIEDVTTNDNNEDTKAFRRIMAVLLPECSLEDLKPIITGEEKQRGVVVLTVAITGPPYDLYGSSSLLVHLPHRLREGMHLLAAVDTTASMKEKVGNARIQSSPESGGDGKSKKGKSNKSIGISHFNKGEEEPTKTQTTAVHHDYAYYQRLYKAILATIMDDEDGLLRDHDASASSNRIPQHPQSLASSNSRVKNNASKSKSKLFTFSRKTNKASRYESGDSIDGDVIPLEIDTDRNRRSDNTSSHAEIARRTALQMEIMSLADDDMSLPKYERVGDNERKRMQAKSPKAGGGGTLSLTSGRFGRKETVFDLAGFEYRPNFAGSASGTASTVASSDEASMVTGDETATTSSKFTMLSNASSVPTLSKSKKDSGARSSRFKFLQKRKKESAAAKTPPTKPHLSLQTKQIPTQEVFDPFRYDGDGVIEEEQEDSVASGSTKETPEQPVQVMSAVSRSFSGDESEGATTLPTVGPSVIEDEGDNMNMLEPEEEEIPVPMRHMSVDLALNEDLTCEYKKSKLSSISVDGTLQVSSTSHICCFVNSEIVGFTELSLPLHISITIDSSETSR